MSTKPDPIPADRPGIQPYLAVKNCAAAIEFYQAAFGVEELYRIEMPDGGIGHAELKIGQAIVMLSDEFPEMGVFGPETLGGSPVTLSMYVTDVDKFVARAVAEGAKVVRPAEDQFYGDRMAKLADPFGHLWSISTHIEDVSPDEMKRRAAELFGG